MIIRWIVIFLLSLGLVANSDVLNDTPKVSIDGVSLETSRSELRTASRQFDMTESGTHALFGKIDHLESGSTSLLVKGETIYLIQGCVLYADSEELRVGESRESALGFMRRKFGAWKIVETPNEIICELPEATFLTVTVSNEKVTFVELMRRLSEPELAP